MRRKEIALTLVACVAVLAPGCSTSRDYYEIGDEISRMHEQPSAELVAEAGESLDQAIDLAMEELGSGDDEAQAARYDSTAYIIPLSWLAKARLAKRFGHVTELEEQCWHAIEAAESHLGEHIAALDAGETEHKILGASVFFRREKIRRHAFALLVDEYRQAGEKDLERLMHAQIGFSETYLLSDVADGEEEYIREVENADWVEGYDMDAEEARYNLLMALLILGQSAQTAASSMREAELNRMQSMDPSTAGYVAAEKQRLQWERQQSLEQFTKNVEKLTEAHQEAKSRIRTTHRATVARALSQNFDLVNVSPAVKNLSAYRELQSKKRDFDNYVRRHGFDEKAAQKLMEVRTSTDDLVRELQRRRAAKAGR
ncbi:MAG: hypothetical protein ACYS99_02320 [Planctomycetota bacterium]|jgi:hypothetical protein